MMYTEEEIRLAYRNTYVTPKGCIVLESAVLSGVYPQVMFEGKQVLAHRLTYAIAKGYPLVDLEGWQILHDCDNPPCRNPEHLRHGTAKDNSDDKMLRNRRKVKLSDKDILTLKLYRLDGYQLKDIAKIFDVSVSYVSLICRDKRKT